jgi:hypothetical protein
MSVETNPHNYTNMNNTFFQFNPVRNSPKEISGANGKFLPKPLLFHLRHPNSKTNQPKFWQILSPKNSFAKTSSALKPHALPEYLEGRTPKEKHPFLFQEKIHPRQIKNARSVFSFGVAGVLASAWGFLRAYDSIQSHHALRAWHIICFENRFELGTINTPKQNSTAFSKPKGGTREARPTDFPPFFQTNSEFLARWRALIFRRGGGSKSEAILTNSICLIQKEFLLL